MPLPFLTGCKAPLDAERIARHAEAEDEVEQGGEGIAREPMVGAAQAGSMREASMVLTRSKMPTIGDQRWYP